MAAETGFRIDRDLYEVPTLDTFTMDEAQVLYDYAGLTLEDFVPVVDENEDTKSEREKRLRNPGFWRALMHVAYQRAHPKQHPSSVKQLVGGANLITAMEDVAGEPEADAVPLASTNEPPQSSPKRTPEPSPDSTNDSTNGSDEQARDPANTGITRSDTSSTWHPMGSAA